MKIGIIGGSGVYGLEGLGELEEVVLETPFGDPSGPFMHGEYAGHEIYFLPRHGVGHSIIPSEVNHRANIFGFKLLGVEAVISATAVGSLREELRPRDIVLPDQYFDRTKQNHTFFGEGLVAHVAFGDPVCPAIRSALEQAAKQVLAHEANSDVRLQVGGTYVCMEGPAFSTRAESNMYRSFGFDVIGMTSLPEAKLCREAEICYQALAMITDYDCWRDGEEDVTAESVVAHLAANTALAVKILAEVIPLIPTRRECGCGTSLASAIMSRPESVPPATLEKLRPLVGKYLGQ